MTDFNDHGFLGRDIERWRSANMTRYSSFFDLAYEVNAFCQRSKFLLKVHSKDGQEVVAVSLLLKMIADFQAAVIVLERGLPLQGQELLRCALEALIILQRVAADPDFASTWAKSDDIDRQRAFEAVQAASVGLPPGVGPAELQAKIDEVRARIEERGAKRLRITRLMNGPEWQSGLYAHWSLPVHSAPRAVQKYVEWGAPGGGLAGLCWGPSEDDVDFTLGTGIAVMLAAWAPIAGLFEIDLQDDVDALDRKLKALVAPDIQS
jgi:hypothetical protein